MHAENSLLIAPLETHGIEWHLPTKVIKALASTPAPTDNFESLRLSTEQKIALFKKLFRGRTDVYPVRWESNKTGKNGYSPVSNNEWWTGICHKPMIKCGEYDHRNFLPVTDDVIYKHLAGESNVGVYPILLDKSGYF